MGASTDPVYIRVVEDLRVQIREGVLAPGTKVPSRFGIMKQYGVGETAAKHALAVLAAEGFIEPRSGSGSYVRQQQEIARLDHDLSRLPGSPFGFRQRTRPAGAGPAGQAGPAGPNGNGHMPPLSWEHQSDRIPAPPQIGRRLRLQGDDGVVRTRYVLRCGPSPIQLATSYEPLQLTAGTPVAQPESGPVAGQGVIARMAAIGIQVDEVVEEIASRPPFSGEAATLEIRPGTRVMHIERSHLAGGRPVETCDIVLAAERYRLRYRFPVPGSPGP
jgi:DNA-binding GntR family transcriptional regulator